MDNAKEKRTAGLALVGSTVLIGLLLCSSRRRDDAKLLHSGAQIGESRELPLQELTAVFNTWRHAGRQSMIDKVGAAQGEGPIQVVSVDQVAKPANYRLILFG